MEIAAHPGQGFLDRTAKGRQRRNRKHRVFCAGWPARGRCAPLKGVLANLPFPITGPLYALEPRLLFFFVVLKAGKGECRDKHNNVSEHGEPPKSKSTHQSHIFFVFWHPGQETKSTRVCNKNYLNALFQSFNSIRKLASTLIMR